MNNRIILVCILLVSIGGVIITHSEVWNPVNRLTFFNVGQGDATFIQTQAGVRILVDCGPPDGQILDHLQDKIGFLSRRIDLLVVTHGDSDHYGGCSKVLDHYQVDTIMINGVKDSENRNYTEFVTQANRNSTVIPGIRGSSITTQDLELTVLHPVPGVWGSEEKNDNQYSIVLHMNTPTLDVLLTGDIPIHVESELIQSGIVLDVDILKAGHHGSKTSTSNGFLEATTPKQVIISAGSDNSFGHPHPEVIQRIEAQNIIIRETKNQSSIDFLF